jgi:hypothetical protein
MSYCRIEAATIVSVPNHKNLLAAWKLYGAEGLVKTFKCDKPLTDAQRRRLPAGLREALA